MKAVLAVLGLASIVLSACGGSLDSNRSSFDGGSDGTWSWNGSTWTRLTDGSAELNLAYWKDFGGLVAFNGSDWRGSRWTGKSWVADDQFPPLPPATLRSQLGWPIPTLDEASDQLLSVDSTYRALWVLNHGVWSEATTASTLPGVQEIQAVGYDPYRRDVVFLAWTDRTLSVAQTWTWNGQALQQSTAAPFHFGDVDLRRVVPDNDSHLLLLGQTSGFEWDGKAWSEVGTGYCPTTAMQVGQVDTAYDAGHHQLIGIGSTGDGTTHTWLWKRGAWTALEPASWPTGGHGSLVYDPELPGLVLTTYQIGDCCWFECGV